MLGLDATRDGIWERVREPLSVLIGNRGDRFASRIAIRSLGLGYRASYQIGAVRMGG